jgi:hypothetical protein
MNRIVRILSKLVQLPIWLNWVLAVVEPLVVLAITFLVGYFIYGSVSGKQEYQIVQLMKVINDNWKASLILFVILFYRTVRMFLEQAEEWPWGLKKKPSLAGESQKEVNPSPLSGEAVSASNLPEESK